MKFHYVVFILVILFFCSHNVSASVVVNEVAWMGTSASVNDEWIELYNPDTTAVALNGWTLNAADGSPMINLSGSIAANSYYLAERTDDTTVPTITAGVIYSGSLANTGETLILKDGSGQQIDIVPMASGWIAGNSDTKETMQKIGTIWVTNTPTPGIQNISGSTNNPVTTGTDIETETITVPTPPKPKTEQEEWEDISKKVDPDTNYSVRMIIPNSIVAQVPVSFSSEVMKFGILKDLTGRFEWSMGDGKSFTFNKSTEFVYMYQRPGTYTIMVNYYSNMFKSKPDTVHQIKINVLEPNIKIIGNSTNSDIAITNNSTGDIDLKNWKLQTPGSEFKFLASTILSKDSTVIVPQTVHRLSNVHTNNISIMTPGGFMIKNDPMSNRSRLQYQTENRELVNESNEKELFETPQTASVINLPDTESKNVYLWAIGFLLLLVLLPIGFYILTSHLKPSEST